MKMARTKVAAALEPEAALHSAVRGQIAGACLSRDSRVKRQGRPVWNSSRAPWSTRLKRAGAAACDGRTPTTVRHVMGAMRATAKSSLSRRALPTAMTASDGSVVTSCAVALRPNCSRMPRGPKEGSFPPFARVRAIKNRSPLAGSIPVTASRIRPSEATSTASAVRLSRRTPAGDQRTAMTTETPVWRAVRTQPCQGDLSSTTWARKRPTRARVPSQHDAPDLVNREVAQIAHRRGVANGSAPGASETAIERAVRIQPCDPKRAA